MYHSFSIKNFRCFDDLTLCRCKVTIESRCPGRYNPA